MGKTRLALRYGELHGASFLSAWFCDLTEARTVLDVCAAVSRALGVALQSEGDRERGAIDFIASTLAEAGPLLLILDNVEQVARITADVLETWTAVASEAFVLVTSRERLGLASEVVVDLMPLELPPADASIATPDGEKSEALLLYEERARSAGGWDDSTMADAAALVRELEGIPLAIELAAARSRVLGADKLLARLANAKKLDVGAARGSSRGRGAARHATLRAAIDSSWEMLSEVERAALAQASIFAGEFSIEAIEAILDVPDVVDVVEALLDKSLIRRSPTTKRFSLYASIREYASERLRAMGEDVALALERRQVRYFLEVGAKLERMGHLSARAALAQEKENLVAIERKLAARASAKALAASEVLDWARVVLSLEPILAVESTFEELLSMLSGALEATRAVRLADPDPNVVASAGVLEARLLIARSAAYGIRGQNTISLEDLEEAKALATAPAALTVDAEARVMASVRYRNLGRFADAEASATDAIARLERAGVLEAEPRLEGSARAVLGLLLCELGRVEESRRENLRARAIFDAAGDRWSEALAIANLAVLDQAAGEWERSAHGYDGALERFREYGDRRYESRYLGYRAGLELERGDIAAARATYAVSIELLAYLRIRPTEALFRAALGALEASEARRSPTARVDAMNELDRAASLLGSADAPRSIVSAVTIHHGHLDLLLAREARARGESERAERFLEAARARIRDALLRNESEDVRFAIRLLERAIRKYETSLSAEAKDAPSMPPPASLSATGATLTIGPDASWFRVVDPHKLGANEEEREVDLGRRGALRLMLLELARVHESERGRATSSESLLAAGWPGERVLPAAGSTRVRVAISTLRRLGLARVLITRNDGYLLDPQATVSFVTGRQQSEQSPRSPIVNKL